MCNYRKVIDIDVYSARVKIYKSTNYISLYDNIKKDYRLSKKIIIAMKEGANDEDGCTLELERKDGGIDFVALLSDNKKIVSTTIHEITHISTRILKSRGIKFKAYDDESLAYLISYLSEEALNNKNYKNISLNRK